MGKLSKTKHKLHNEALELVRQDEPLTMTEKEFVIENYKPYAEHNVTETNAFFTPLHLAIATTVEMPNPDEYNKPVRILDICAGIGLLSFAYYHHSGHRCNMDDIEMVCVELEPEYIEVGKKILPEATWIQGNIMDNDTIEQLGKDFDCFISNPPFMKMGNYKGTYTVSIIGMSMAEYGVMIVPQGNCPFDYSGQPFYEETYNRDYNKFEDKELIKFSASCVDTEEVLDDNDDPIKWDNVNITTEIVIVEDLVENPRALTKAEMT